LQLTLDQDDVENDAACAKGNQLDARGDFSAIQFTITSRARPMFQI